MSRHLPATPERRPTISPALVVLTIASVVVLIVGWFGCREAERRIRAEWRETQAADAGAPLHTIRAIYTGWGGLLLIAFTTSAWLHWRWFRAERRSDASRREFESLARHFQMVLDSATQVSIVATDMSGTITLFNAGAERMLGYRAEEVVGKLTPAMIHLEEEVRAHGEALSRQFGRKIEGFGVFVEYARQGRFEDREWTYVRKDGTRLSVSLVVTALTDSAGRMTGFLGIGHDVTERLATEQALREAKETAERANRAKSEFLATMSHEIRTPMNAVIGLTDLVLDGELTPVQRDYLESARDAAEGLMTIINEVLDFSKIEATQVALERVPFSLRALVGDVVKTLAPRAVYKRLELTWRVAPDVPDVLRGDPTRLRQVLVNLVGNALKFTEHGQVTVEVDESGEVSGEERAARLHFRVRDTGIGIAPEKRDEIFLPFTQADMSTTRRFGGTGLGLSICVKLVRLMEGRLWVESEPEVGSVFHVEVALERGTVADLPECARSTPRESSSGASTAAAPRGAQLRILVGEDVVMNQKLARGLLARWGHLVEVASNGREVLRRLDERPFDLVLMDVSMPELDGLEATREIRRREAGTSRRLPIVAMTAHAFAADEARAYEAGMDGYVTKPIRRQELAAVIERIFPPESLPGRLDSTPLVTIDWDRVLQELDGDRDLLRDILEVCLDEAPRLTRRLSEATAARDATACGRAAHALRGALRLLAPAGVVDRVETLDVAARSGDFERLHDELKVWQDEWVKIHDSVEGFLRSLRNDRT